MGMSTASFVRGCAGIGCVVALAGVSVVWLIGRDAMDARKPAPSPSYKTSQEPSKPGPKATPWRPTWSAQQDTSKVDDTKNTLLYIGGEPKFQDWLGRQHAPELVIQCRERKLTVFVRNGTPANHELGNYGHAHVTIRFDKTPARTLNAGDSTDNKALFLPGGAGLVRDMLKHEKMLYRFTPFKKAAQETEFPLWDLDKHLPKLAPCGFKAPRPAASPSTPPTS
jgi:hypothetical protein